MRSRKAATKTSGGRQEERAARRVWFGEGGRQLEHRNKCILFLIPWHDTKKWERWYLEPRFVATVSRSHKPEAQFLGPVSDPRFPFPYLCTVIFRGHFLACEEHTITQESRNNALQYCCYMMIFISRDDPVFGQAIQ